MESTSQSTQNLLNGRYKKIDKLGEGSFGTVYKAFDMKPHKIRNKVDQKYLNMIEKAEKDSG